MFQDKISEILKKQTVKSLGVVGSSKIISIVFGLITVSMSARGLGVEQYGQLAYFFAVSEIFYIFSLPGFNLILQKQIIKNEFSFLKTSIVYTSIASLFTYIIFEIINSIATFENVSIYRFALLFNLFRSFDKLEVFFSSSRRFKYLAYYTVVASLFRFLTIGVSSYIYESINISVCCFIVTQFFIGIWSLIVCKKTSGGKKYQGSGTRESIEYTISNILSIISVQIDRLLLGRVSASTLSIYQAGIAYPEKLRELSKTFSSSLANMWLGYGVEEYEKRLKKNSITIIVLLLVLSVVLFISADLYIPMLLGKEFNESILYAKYVSIIIPFKILNHFLLNKDIVFTEFRKHQIKTVIYRLFYIVFVIIGFNFYFIEGMMLGILVSEAVFLAMLIKKDGKYEENISPN